MTRGKKYTDHPGLPIAIVLLFFGIMAGVDEHNPAFDSFILGAVIMYIFCWVCVFIKGKG